MELELEGFTGEACDVVSRQTNPFWRLTHDGSLRNGGVELITNGGLGGAKLFEAFERLARALETVQYDASFRCSTHMHINMLDFTIPQVVKFILTYCACEPILFKFCGEYRKSSNFCTPISESMPFHRKLISTMLDDCISSRVPARHAIKYTALNVLPLFPTDRGAALGTVEFRGGRPLVSLDDMVLQANLLLSIKEYVRTHEGTEEQLLVSLMDGVYNTVYQNGVAIDVHVPVEELENSLTHAWCLLKVYQESQDRAKKARSKKPVSNEWGATMRSNLGDYATFNGQTVQPVETPIAVSNSSRPLRMSDVSFSYESWSLFFDYIAILDGQQDVTIETINQTYWRTVDQTGSDVSQSLGRDIYYIWSRNYPGGASLATYLAAHRGRTRGLNQDVIHTLNNSAEVVQCRLAEGQRFPRINYALMDPESYNRMLNIYYGLTRPRDTNNGVLYDIFVHNRTQLQQIGLLRDKARARGLRTLERLLNNTDVVSMCEAYVIFRLLGVRSSSHIQQDDWSIYRKIAALMTIAAGCNFQIPVVQGGSIKFLNARGGIGLANVMETRTQASDPVCQIGGIYIY